MSGGKPLWRRTKLSQCRLTLGNAAWMSPSKMPRGVVHVDNDIASSGSMMLSCSCRPGTDPRLSVMCVEGEMLR
eukprot:5386642-Prorocentrum_lima.AAC.1